MSVFAFLLAVFAQAAGAPTPAPTTNENFNEQFVARIGVQFLEYQIKGDYCKAFDMVHKSLQPSLPPTQLELGISAVEAGLGEFVRINEPKPAVNNKNGWVDVSTSWTYGNQTARINVHPDGLIMGMQWLPIDPSRIY